MPTPIPRSDGGLRGLLVADRERSQRRWAVAGRPDEWLEDLRAHVPVGVSSGQLMRALFRAGVACDEFCFGGRYFKANFILDEDDQLHECE